MGVRVGLIVGNFDKQTDDAAQADGADTVERTNGGILIFFSVLLISASISTYGIWKLAQFLIHEFS